MQIQPTKILSGGRITLPKEFLSLTRLSEGDFVGLVFSDNRIIVQPIKVEARK